MTNQYIAQMPEIVQSAVFGTGQSFHSVWSKDASTLIKEFEPVFEANDMVNLDNYNIYVKMAIDGVTCPAFSSITLPPYTDKSNNRDEIISYSRSRYSVDRESVEEVINQSAEFSMQNTSESDAKPKYPRQYDREYLELRDPETGDIFYTPGILDEAKEASATSKLPEVLSLQTSLPEISKSQFDMCAQPLDKPPICNSRGVVTPIDTWSE